MKRHRSINEAVKRVAAILVSIIVLVFISEMLSAWARNTVMKMK